MCQNLTFLLNLRSSIWRFDRARHCFITHKTCVCLCVCMPSTVLGTWDPMLKNSEKFLILTVTGITCTPSSFPAKACKGSNDLYSGIKNNLSFLIWKTKTLAVICFLVIFHLPVILSWNSLISDQTPLLVYDFSHVTL